MRMAEYCARCGKKIGFLGGINEPFPDQKGRGVCDDCEKVFKFKIDVEIQDWARKGMDLSEIKEAICQRFSTNYEESTSYLRAYVDYKKDEIERVSIPKRAEETERREAINRVNFKAKDILVTTCNLKEDYEIIGPVYFQVSNKGIFSSAYSELVRKYSNKIAEMKRSGNLSKEKADWGFLYGEWSVGQNDFEKAFYIAVEELKKKAALLDADAIIGMRQDIDLDTNGFSYFYLQMYGTAVKYKR